MVAVVTQDQWLSTPCGRLYVKQWSPSRGGSGHAPIVMFHDSLGSVELWRAFPEQLAEATGRSVIAYDRLGFGKSDANPAVLAADFIRDEALDGFQSVRQGLGVVSFVAFGHSVGGGMAVGCAARFGADCEALITVSAQAFVEDRTLRGIMDARVAFGQPGQLERLAKYHGDKAQWVLSAWIDTWLSPGFADWSLDADLKQVFCPALAIHGEQDEFGSALHPQRIAELSRGRSAFEILADCGHSPHREYPEVVAGLVQRWLDQA
ncbi:alpha/beta fold hydrolase [Dyella sp. C9]|uniref:alpha/beta fold hydrolase n=1 Tax=Dyella sp. C9 TaxID=2202154 RepID=UPI000DEECB93|nr:alpha/beta hydrolase [Dyella sp. C9]